MCATPKRYRVGAICGGGGDGGGGKGAGGAIFLHGGSSRRSTMMDDVVLRPPRGYEHVINEYNNQLLLYARGLHR